MLSDRVLVFEKTSDECLVEYGDIQGVQGVVFAERPAGNDFGADGLKELRRHARPARARVFLASGLRPALDANSLVPAIAACRRVKHRGRHPHFGDLREPIVDLAEQLRHLLGLLRAQRWIDPCDITGPGLEAEILMLRVSQALRQQCGRREQHQRHRRLWWRQCPGPG
jgi:hypothetical protein